MDLGGEGDEDHEGWEGMESIGLLLRGREGSEDFKGREKGLGVI